MYDPPDLGATRPTGTHQRHARRRDPVVTFSPT
jgi:hypothetical protein